MRLSETHHVVVVLGKALSQVSEDRLSALKGQGEGRSHEAEQSEPSSLFRFLALLDYVSRAHEIEIRPSSVLLQSSIVRPYVASIISEVIVWISFKF